MSEDAALDDVEVLVSCVGSNCPSAETGMLVAEDWLLDDWADASVCVSSYSVLRERWVGVVRLLRLRMTCVGRVIVPAVPSCRRPLATSV